MSRHLKNIPKHIAIIMDGNGRWAKNEGKERLFGHHNGVKSVRQVVEAAVEIGVEYMTLYAFSTENWGRPAEEVDGLMLLLSATITNELESMTKNGVKFHFIGDLKALPEGLQREIKNAEDTYVENIKLNLVIAINYSSRWEIKDAVQRIVKKGIPAEEITEQTISENLQTSFMPDPELLIRTSGEIRISNFMLWQLSYTELYFTSILWPEFGKKELIEAIEQYNIRDRRFGLTK